MMRNPEDSHSTTGFRDTVLGSDALNKHRMQTILGILSRAALRAAGGQVDAGEDAGSGSDFLKTDAGADSAGNEASP